MFKFIQWGKCGECGEWRSRKYLLSFYFWGEADVSQGSSSARFQIFLHRISKKTAFTGLLDLPSGDLQITSGYLGIGGVWVKTSLLYLLLGVYHYYITSSKGCAPPVLVSKKWGEGLVTKWQEGRVDVRRTTKWGTRDVNPLSYWITVS